MWSILLLLIVFLFIILLLFILADWLLKHDKKQVTKDNTAKPTTEAKIDAATTVATEKPLPVMNVYNSNLADDLDKMLKSEEKSTVNNQAVTAEKQTTNKGHIANYIAQKNYQTFSFTPEFNEETGEDMKFTKEDYKKFVALSNIDDKK